MASSYDFIVVGAGPSGSMTALRLASLEYEVLVLEARQRVGEAVCCTGIIGEECFDHFSLDSELVLKTANSARFYTPSGRMLRLEKEEVQAYIVDRSLLDRALAQRAQHAGARYILGSVVRDVVVQDSHIRVEADVKDKKESFKAEAVVIAAGFGSRFPQQLDLGKIGEFLAGAQAEVDVSGLDEVEVYFGREVAAEGFAWLVPTYPGKALAGLLSRRDLGTKLRDFLARLSAQKKIASQEARIAYGAIPIKPLPKTYGERMIVVGDAAGQVKPITGGGIYYGLLCAEMGAEALHRAFVSRDFSSHGLASYQREWWGKLSRELNVGYWARKFYERLSDSRIEHIFDIIESNGIHNSLLREESLSFDWHAGLIIKALKQHALSGVTNWRPW
jgi:geranylgeranyl reductase family protein